MTETSASLRKPPLAVRALRKAWRLLRDPAFRGRTWIYWGLRKGAFQPVNDTRPDRYPAIFRFVRERLGAEAPLNILSFGCSTGEEVFSLRSYFSKATIKGLDVNRGNIAAAQRRLRREADAALSFAVAASTAAEPAAHYDAIFCMAVLRHGSLGLPGVTRCDHLIRFEDFAQTIADFHRCLKPGGLLIVRHSNFRLRDTPAGADFDCILSLPVPAAADKTPIFGPDNRLLPGVDDPDTVFRKTL